MSAQVITGRVTDVEGLAAQVRRWQQDLRPEKCLSDVESFDLKDPWLPGAVTPRRHPSPA